MALANGQEGPGESSKEGQGYGGSYSGKPGIVLFSINYILTFRAGFDQMKSYFGAKRQ